MKGEAAPFCIGCNEDDLDLTVKHLLLNCADFIRVRQRFYKTQDLKGLFDKESPSTIIDFLKEAGLLLNLL